MASAVATAGPALHPAFMPLGEGHDRTASGAARMVDAILEFSTWPSPPSIVRFCVVGEPKHAGRLGDISLSTGAKLLLFRLAPDSLPGMCDVLYFGGLDVAASRRLMSSARGAAIVTIAEDDPDCRSGAMFCLIFGPNDLSFQLNIDAISRSAMRIDPRVLRVSKGRY